MKRFIAAAIDVSLLKVAGIIIYCIVISILRICRNSMMKYMGSYSVLLLFIVYFCVLTVVHFSYFFYCEWCGQSIGKIIVRIKTENREEISVWKKAAIAGIKTIACFLYPITIGYYFFFDKMPYDKMRNKNDL